MLTVTELSLSQLIPFAAVALIAILFGALLNQKFTRSRWQSIKDELIGNHNELLQQLELQLSECKAQLEQSQFKLEQQQTVIGSLQTHAQRNNQLESQLSDLQRKAMQTQLELSKSNAMQQMVKVQYETEKSALEEKIELLKETEERLNTQFENMANRIFESRSEKFHQQNNHQMDAILSPFKQQLEGFRKQVQESYSQEQSQRTALQHQLDSLKTLNQQMSLDAVNLTNALKGDNKQQGNWGEVILSRVLEESGLREGHEYQTQQDLKNEQGKHFKPDVIVHLPENKDVVIDSKVSLTAYERYFNSDDTIDQQQAIKAHILSLKNHIKGLSQKDYQQLHGLTSLDYVLMFIPLEPAFLLAIEQEPALINYALEHNIMLVSPTNLLVALRTINNIWRYEYQNQNAQQIAKQAGKIYDKLCGFLVDMEKLGRAIETAEKSFDTAMNKLTSGRGNVIKQAHQLQLMGVETSKKIDQQLIEQALTDVKIDSTSLN